MGVAVFVTAHEDDETLSMGAAIVNHVNAGHRVYTLVCTDGSNSGVFAELQQSHGLTRDQFCQARYNEYINAAAALGLYSQCSINTSCYNTGYLGMLKDSTLNLGARYSYDANGLTRTCINPGYDGNELGINYEKVNSDLYYAIRSSLQSIAQSNGISMQNLLVKTHSHRDCHEDHRAVCQAVLRLYAENYISDVRHYVSPAQWDSSIRYPSGAAPSVQQVYESANQLDTSIETPSQNQSYLRRAILNYVEAGTDFNYDVYHGSVKGTDRYYGIGYKSVSSAFDKVDNRKCSYYHVPPSIRKY